MQRKASAAWQGGLRLVNAQLVEDQSLCAIEPRTSHSFDETATIEAELEHLHALQDYVDAQSGGPGKGSGRRQLKVRLKTARQRSASSQRWLERQLNDPYVARAKREGFRSRAAYKLMEIDDKARILKSGAHVVDLGAPPGGWRQVDAARVGAGGAPRPIARQPSAPASGA